VRLLNDDGVRHVEVMLVQVDGVGLHVEVEGPREQAPVVFLHGVGSSGRTWEWLPRSATRGRRIVRVDLRGHGRSDHAAGTYDLERYGADVVGVLRELTSRPVLLVGNSLGGVVAWWIAQSHPELVAAALLEDPPLLAGETPPTEAGRFRDVFHAVKATIVHHRARELPESALAERLGGLCWAPGTPALGEVLTDDAIAALAFGYHRLDLGVIDGAIDGSTLAAADTRAPVGPPVVVVAADDAAGAAFSTRDAERLAETQPAVRVARIAGSGHRIHDERRHRGTFLGHLSGFMDAYTG
jgi:pimeloyl-ACP methyl ester carboxylesterase